MEVAPEQSCEVDFKTVVYYNTLKIKKFSSLLTGWVKSGWFYGTSAHSSQSVSWYYNVNPCKIPIASTKPDTVIQVITATTSANNAQLHGEVETVLETTSLANLKVHGNIKVGQKIGDDMAFPRAHVDYYLLADDTLTIRFKFSLHEQVLENAPTPQPEPLPDIQLLDHLADLLESKKFSDVTVVVGSTEFRVHKAILTARSPVFAAMFGHNMQESKENRVTIDDIEPRVFQQVLRFIYTGVVKNLDHMACELLAAADKYALGHLRTICEENLGSTLSVESATKTLYLADLHHADQLKQQAIRFIAGNIKVIQKEDWKSIIATNPEVAADMFAEMARLS
uniref:Speckle-type POZ protein n=2 Tax=Culex pipiens TaxID=7175 RepID=A0A8D8DND2_CULPI